MHMLLVRTMGQPGGRPADASADGPDPASSDGFTEPLGPPPLVSKPLPRSLWPQLLGGGGQRPLSQHPLISRRRLSTWMTADEQ